MQKAGNDIISPTASDDLYFGLNGSAGIEYMFSQSIGMFMSYCLEYNRIKSTLYNDNHFSVSQFNAGIIVKLLKSAIQPLDFIVLLTRGVYLNLTM